MNTSTEKMTATLINLSTLTQYFIPFGNFIFPIVIWSSKKDESEYIDYNGKQTLNFQLSVFLYTIVLCLIAIPIFIYTVFKNIPFENLNGNHDFFVENFSAGNITGIVVLGIVAVLLFCFLKIIEFILIIYAAVKTSNGENYKYPMSIPFFK
jgi:uncharacterized Tic20 family protein